MRKPATKNVEHLGPARSADNDDRRTPQSHEEFDAGFSEWYWDRIDAEIDLFPEQLH